MLTVFPFRKGEFPRPSASHIRTLQHSNGKLVLPLPNQRIRGAPVSLEMIGGPHDAPRRAGTAGGQEKLTGSSFSVQPNVAPDHPALSAIPVLCNLGCDPDTAYRKHRSDQPAAHQNGLRLGSFPGVGRPRHEATLDLSGGHDLHRRRQRPHGRASDLHDQQRRPECHARPAGPRLCTPPRYVPGILHQHPHRRDSVTYLQRRGRNPVGGHQHPD